MFLTAAGSYGSIPFGLIALAFWAVLIMAAMLGVSKAKREAAARDAYLNGMFPNTETRAVFNLMYGSRKKSVTTTYLLSVLLGPTIGYVYLGEWGIAIISLLTLQGLGIWWVLGIFTAWSWAIQHNKRAETDVIEFFLSHVDHESGRAVEPVIDHTVTFTFPKLTR